MLQYLASTQISSFFGAPFKFLNIQKKTKISQTLIRVKKNPRKKQQTYCTNESSNDQTTKNKAFDLERNKLKKTILIVNFFIVSFFCFVLLAIKINQKKRKKISRLSRFKIVRCNAYFIHFFILLLVNYYQLLLENSILFLHKLVCKTKSKKDYVQIFAF